jgi:hypothetical protein
MLREAARRLDLAGVIADPLPDKRNPLFVIHSYRAMVTARMMAIATSYEDADDLDALRYDPALIIACERAPETGRVIARVEAIELGTDARFVVTNLTGRGKHLSEKVYCARWCMENLIKDMKMSTRSDKTACSRWQANQFRLSCTWVRTGSCIRCGWRRRSDRAGAARPSPPSAACS